MTPQLSVVTITYNERENVSIFIETINRLFLEHHLNGEIVVVDDNSPDGTSEVVKELQKKYPHTMLLTRPGKMGIGSAYKTGVEASQGEVIALMDADLSHSPAILPEMYRRTQEGKIIFGSRFLEETRFETDLPHRIGTYLLNFWVRLWLRTGIRDHTNGYLVLQKEMLHTILEYGESKNLRPFDHILYGITVAAIAKKLHFPREEIKAEYNKRKAGETKISFLWGVKVVSEDMLYTLKIFSKL